MSEDPKSQLKQVALDCSERAIYWRRRFRLIAWVNVCAGVLWLGLGVLFITTHRELFVIFCGVALLALGTAGLLMARNGFGQARSAFNNLMRIRQECLEAIDICDR